MPYNPQLCVRARPTIVVSSAVGLALKDHGRDGTFKGLRGVNPLDLARAVGVPV